MNSMQNARNGNIRRIVAKVPVGNAWDAGASKCGQKVKSLNAAQRAKMAAARPLPARQNQADTDAIAAYLARVAK